MKSKITTIILTLLLILFIGVFIIVGIILYNEINSENQIEVPEKITTFFTDIFNEIEKNNNLSEIPVSQNPLDEIEGVNSNQEIDVEQYREDRYFYNQLDNPAKIIYTAFEKNKDMMKTGVHKIELGENVSNILKELDGKEKLGNYYQSAIEAYIYDNPEIFYLEPNKMYLNIETTTTRKGETYNAYINNGSKNNYLIDEMYSIDQIGMAMQQIETVKNDILSKRTGNVYKDIKMVHDYLVNNIEYDRTLSMNNIYNIYGALVNKMAVCEGYARSFKYIMDEMNIPCVLIIGKATNSEGNTENHAWNYVKVNGNWYAIDTTWDDPIIIGGGTIGLQEKYKYFLKGKNEFLKDHIPNGQFTPDGQIFEYPELSEFDCR